MSLLNEEIAMALAIQAAMLAMERRERVGFLHISFCCATRPRRTWMMSDSYHTETPQELLAQVCCCKDISITDLTARHSHIALCETNNEKNTAPETALAVKFT